MEAQETKSNYESMGRQIEKYLEILMRDFKQIILRLLTRVAPKTAQKLQAKWENKHGSALKAVKEDGSTKEREKISDLSYEEFVELAIKAEQDGIKCYGEPEDHITKTSKSKKNLKLDTKSKIDKLRNSKKKLDIAERKYKDKPNNKYRYIKYIKAKKEWKNDRKHFEKSTYGFVCNARHKTWLDKHYDEILEKRKDKFSANKSKILRDIKKNNERSNSSQYDYKRAELWIQEQEQKGKFLEFNKEQIQKEVDEHFERFKYDGNVNQSKFEKNYIVHSVDAVTAAEIVNQLEKYPDEYNKNLEYYVQHQIDDSGQEIAKIYINDEDMNYYMPFTKKGKINHIGDKNKKDTPKLVSPSPIRIPLYDNQLSSLQKHLKDANYSFKYEKQTDGNICPVFYFDTNYTNELVRAVEKEKSLSSTQNELNEIISTINSKIEGNKQIIEEQSEEKGLINMDFDIDLDNID